MVENDNDYMLAVRLGRCDLNILPTKFKKYLYLVERWILGICSLVASLKDDKFSIDKQCALAIPFLTQYSSRYTPDAKLTLTSREYKVGRKHARRTVKYTKKHL